MENPTDPEDLPTPRDVKILARQLEPRSKTLTRKRNVAFLLALWDTGARVGEILNVKKSGYIKDKMKAEKYFSSLVKFIRKNQGKLIIIGHTVKDLHHDIRRLSNYIQKGSKKEAKVYKSVENEEGETQNFKLENIPACSEEFDTREESS